MGGGRFFVFLSILAMQIIFKILIKKSLFKSADFHQQ
jgi:hypothetical protein